MKPPFDFKAKEKWARGLSDAEIAWNLQDASAAAKAWPGGENESYYLDEINVLLDERRRRKEKGTPCT